MTALDEQIAQDQGRYRMQAVVKVQNPPRKRVNGCLVPRGYEPEVSSDYYTEAELDFIRDKSSEWACWTVVHTKCDGCYKGVQSLCSDSVAEKDQRFFCRICWLHKICGLREINA